MNHSVLDSIQFTDTAIEYIQKLLDKQEKKQMGVRLFVTNPGTPHAETCLAYCQEGAQKSNDTEIKLEGFSAWIENESISFLEDAQIDFTEDQLGGQLTIKAPNAKLPKIDEDTPLDKKIIYYLQTEINPNLAAHGGIVSLVSIEEDKTAILQFGGGCQGCGMVDVTLKDGVEKTLKEKIPELTGVKDITDHSKNENAYYK